MTRIKTLSTAAIAALGLALTPVPAAADGQDLAKALAGLAVIGLIAKAVDDRRDRKKAARLGQIESHDGRRVLQGELYRPGTRAPEPRHNARHFALPDQCIRVVQGGGRDRLVYGARCLQRRYQHSADLPQWCERDLRTDRGLRRVFAARCLARDGWRVARR
ncbi:MAG: hypothetical protein OIF48_15990 [Silicimonas sp.]|nr:hypothetical protein [Silicimonas sp.]